MPGYSNLGDPAAAHRNLDRALTILDATPTPDTPALIVSVLIDAARISSFADHNPAKALADLSRADAVLAAHPALPTLLKGEALSERAAALRWRNDFSGEIAPAKALAVAPPDPGAGRPIWSSRQGQPDLLAEATFYAVGGAAAVQPHRDTPALLETTHRLYPASRLAALRLARARWALGSTLLSLKQIPEALALLTASSSDLRRMVAFDRDDMEAARQLQVVEFLDRAEALTGTGIGLLKASH